MKYAYYPGCSLKGTGRGYDESLRFVFGVLNVEIEELEDWNCCGATSYVSVDDLTSYALAARNLALAERDHRDIVAPCAACYLVLNKTRHYISDYPFVGHVVERALSEIGLAYTGQTQVRHPLDILVHEVGIQAIAKKVKAPLRGLKVAPYYGCQIVRPYATFDDQRSPTSMDQLLVACGATAIDYSEKVRCCGASQKGALSEVGLDRIRRLLHSAQAEKAEVIATACPLCQFNLECYQEETGNEHPAISMPILFFTQLIALALGASAEEIGLKRCLVPMEPLLASKEIAYA